MNHQGSNFGVDAVDVKSAVPICQGRLPKRCVVDAERASARGGGISRLGSTTRNHQRQADRDVVVLLGNAQQQADQTRGAGDAEGNRIFAEAYGKDAEVFAFYRSMQAYKTG